MKPLSFEQQVETSYIIMAKKELPEELARVNENIKSIFVSYQIKSTFITNRQGKAPLPEEDILVRVFTHALKDFDLRPNDLDAIVKLANGEAVDFSKYSNGLQEAIKPVTDILDAVQNALKESGTLKTINALAGKFNRSVMQADADFNQRTKGFKGIFRSRTTEAGKLDRVYQDEFADMRAGFERLLEENKGKDPFYQARLARILDGALKDAYEQAENHLNSAQKTRYGNDVGTHFRNKVSVPGAEINAEAAREAVAGPSRSFAEVITQSRQRVVLKYFTLNNIKDMSY